MSRARKVTQSARNAAWKREYQKLLRQWMNNAAALAQDEIDPQFRHYLRAWYQAFEDVSAAVEANGEIQIRVYSTAALPNFDREDTYSEVE